MSKDFRLIFLLLLAVCVRADSVTDKLEEIYRQYRVAGTAAPEVRLQLLVKLDQDLRGLFDRPFMVANKPLGVTYWKKKYQLIGVGAGLYNNDVLSYSGKLLLEARALDANGTYASYTHYANVCGGYGSFAGCDVPNPAAALQYEKEFPDGPFIEDTLIVLGDFYDDLFKALEMKDGPKYACFSKYIRKAPVAQQRERARKLAILYYGKVVAIGSANRVSNKSVREFKSKLESGQSLGWHFCSD